ncbi:rho GTPase-activating protein 30 [Phyllobates terribilis]|uniref:rho GTPase-activating protein 30 n=1 Tax=Phyllobates terribilis TaxID=111132 RepID=UPI003CCB0AFB
MSLAMKARQRVKKKTVKDKIFGCDLLEHLQMSGQEVPQVLKSCAEFVEEHGIVDGIYRLCGIASNVQKLRQEFDIERPPDLNKSTYLQDVHCVSSLCKAYFRELPNPLLTYQLYDKFADAVAIQLEEQRLIKIREVLKELPLSHYRTLEYLMKHLLRMASYSSQTNMHSRNLAIVWAPNLLRSKDIESSGFNGTAAFMEVRVQSIVVEFILTHVEQLFGDCTNNGKENEGSNVDTMNWPSCVPEDYYRSLSYNLPNMLSHGDGPPQIRPYHTIIEFSDHKRKGSLKAKKWKSIFNLGRSNPDSKRKSQKHDDGDGKMSLRPAKSMDSLSSVPHTTHANDLEQNGSSLRSPRNQLSLRRESLDSPSKDENVEFMFLDPEEQSHSIYTNDVEYEEEGQAKSEPTTPKSGRSSTTGNPPGRSPKSNLSRAEKCVGVHISGPFSVTLPFHITSNLSRLTRGMECPGLNMMAPNRSSEKFSSLDGKPSSEPDDTNRLGAREVSANEIDNPAGTETSETEEPGAENVRISLEDTFSFLDLQDSSIEKLPDNTADSEMMGYPLHLENKMEEFSVEPPPDDLCGEEEAEQTYFMPMGIVDEVGRWREMQESLEDIYMSAHDDLSPITLAPEVTMENKELPSEEQHSILPENTNRAGEAPQNEPLQLNEDFYRQEHPPTVVTVSDTQCNDKQKMDDQHTNPGDGATEEHDSYGEESELTGSYATNNEVQDATSVKSGAREGQNMAIPNTESIATISAPKEVHHERLGQEEDIEILNSQKLEDSLVHTVHETAENSMDCTAQQHHGGQDKDLLEALLTPQQSMDGVQDLNILQSEGARKNGDCKNDQDSSAEISDSHDRGDDASSNTSDNNLSKSESGSSVTPSTGHMETVRQQDNGTEGKAAEELESIVNEYCSDENSHPCLCSSDDVVIGVDQSDQINMGTSEERLKDCPQQQNPAHVKPSGDSETYVSEQSLISRPPAEKEDIASEGMCPYGSVTMKLMATTNKIQQAKSVPVVPPKPQFAKLPPALKNKIQVSSTISTSRETESEKSSHAEILEPPADSAPKKRSSWRNTTSISFDTAMAMAKERQSQNPVRRMQTYCMGDCYDLIDTSKPDNPNLPRFTVKSASSRAHRPFSCMSQTCGEGELQGPNIVVDLTIPGHQSILSQEPEAKSEEAAYRNRLSMPRLGQQSACDAQSKYQQQRRSLL